MRYIEAVTQYIKSDDLERSVFLAGSINGAPNWQQKYRTFFEDTDLVLLNPRRALCDTPNAVWTGEEGQRQIDWEYEHLRHATVVSFWFAAEGQGYSSAYELGAMLQYKRAGAVFVGTHPLYPKAETITYQARKARPDLDVVQSMRGLANQVRHYFGYEPIKED